jgi:hypothetical protein
MKLEPPLSFEGPPLDAQLAAVHARVGYLWVKDEFFLFPVRHERRLELRRVNERWRRDWAEPFGSLEVFAQDDRLAYFYATVPGLEDAKGRRPVVWVDVYEDLYAVPVASSVDMFFDTYARYLERALDTREDEEAPPPRPFPWSASGIIARDRELVAGLQAGRFDFLMPQKEELRQWVSQVVGASVRR